MGRKLAARPAHDAGRKIAEAAARDGLAVLATRLGIDPQRLARVIAGQRTATVVEALAVYDAGIAVLTDWRTASAEIKKSDASPTNS